MSTFLYAVAMPDRRGPVRCSFCGKQEAQVRRILAGPGIYICNQCVYLCEEMLKEEQILNDTAPTEELSALRAEIQRLHGLLRLESRLVKDLRAESERLRAKPKVGRPSRPVKS
jgi:ribosomal protein L37AE/L43A